MGYRFATGVLVLLTNDTHGVKNPATMMCTPLHMCDGVVLRALGEDSVIFGRPYCLCAINEADRPPRLDSSVQELWIPKGDLRILGSLV